ncbi:MAG: pilus assembly protein PilP [Pseudomonadota bacterium]
MNAERSSARLNVRSPRAAWLLVVIASAFAAGCGGSMTDLEQYIDDVKSKPGQRPEPLPEIKPYVTFTYIADTEELRSPFEPDVPNVQSGGAVAGVRPDSNRSREFLEEFPLDSFDMVGTLSISGNDYGLLQGQDGLVHRVLPGNYVGQNDGRITSITESEIKLTEIVSNGIGGYIEREVAIALAD